MVKKTTSTQKNKKSASAKSGNKEDAQRDSLAKELKGLIPKLDSEGLAFLVEQARVHLYNMQVEELNNAAIAADSAREKSRAMMSKTAKPKSTGSNFRIDGTESGSSYYLHYGNDNVMFSRDEMIRLVKIVNGEGTSLEIRERLYNWFDRERRDIFALVNMQDKFDERLKILVTYIKKNFKLK